MNTVAELRLPTLYAFTAKKKHNSLFSESDFLSWQVCVVGRFDAADCPLWLDLV